ncbi:MAG: S8 family serine peptidase, partial [Candidatus Aenigmarchaeota archaeon]|nr:S8 family serine peptidase [Candidatus Aenigmarchaeota archaeon]
AIIDTGVDYTHPDLGNCTGMGIIQLPREPVLDNATESPHPYNNSYDYTWNITQDGFSHISVHFVNISTESSYDYVYVLNATDDIVASYSGTFTEFWTPAIEGNLIKIRLVTDISVTGYGFYIDKAANGTYASNNSCDKVIGGYDFVNDDNDPMDDHGHGTHVAATAAGNGSLKGVAPGARLLAYKVLNAYGSGSTSGVIAGIERAVNDSADIISMSLGSSGNPDDPASVAVDNAVDAGVVVVVAAGNSGPYAQTIMSPGTARNAITVGATDDSDVIADFSSRGPVVWGNSSIIKPDVVAPGVEICAAQYGSAWSDSLCIDNEHVSISGTSMATPHVAGLSALMLQVYPEWSPADVKSVIMGSAIDLGYDMATQGAGRVDAFGFYNVSIQTYPQTISIDFAEGAYAVSSEILRIKNLRNYTIEINLTAGLANNTAGNGFNISSLNTSFTTIPANSEITVNFTVNLTVNKGTLFGKITILAEGKNYIIPYQAMQLVRVNISTTSDAEYPDFYIHDDDFSERLDAGYGIEYAGNNYSFIVDSNKNYTFYAVSSFDEPSLEYILINRTYVSGAGASIVLNLSDARPFNVVAEAFDGRQLKLYEWQKGFLSYNSNGDIFGVNYFSGYEYGNRTVYVSNKPEGSVDTDIVLKYYGIPVS